MPPVTNNASNIPSFRIPDSQVAFDADKAKLVTLDGAGTAADGTGYLTPEARKGQLGFSAEHQQKSAENRATATLEQSRATRAHRQFMDQAMRNGVLSSFEQAKGAALAQDTKVAGLTAERWANGEKFASQVGAAAADGKLTPAEYGAIGKTGRASVEMEKNIDAAKKVSTALHERADALEPLLSRVLRAF